MVELGVVQDCISYVAELTLMHQRCPVMQVSKARRFELAKLITTLCQEGHHASGLAGSELLDQFRVRALFQRAHGAKASRVRGNATVRIQKAKIVELSVAKFPTMVTGDA